MAFLEKNFCEVVAGAKRGRAVGRFIRSAILEIGDNVPRAEHVVKRN
jgi:hypothetical protein